MKIRALLVMAVLSLLTACHGGDRPLTPAEQFVRNLGFDYYLMKDPTASGPGWIVIEHNGFDYAIDIDYGARWSYAFDVDYFWAYAVPVWYVGGGYYEDGFGNLYEKTQGNSKDLLAVSAKVEETKAGLLADKIATQYGLSLERAAEVGKYVTEYKKVNASRAMTDADADKFGMPVLGFKISDAIKAGNNGDTATINQLIEKAAETNDTTPENIRNIMVKFITN